MDKGDIPGAVLLVARDGNVAHFDAMGWQGRELKVQMQRDSVFPHRIDDQAGLVAGRDNVG